VRIRAYFWEDRVITPQEFRLRVTLDRSPYNHFVVGNAGDILARDLVRRIYGCQVHLDRKRGKRLLLVGSVATQMRDGDLICGIGAKTPDFPSASQARVHVWAVRGPRTLEAMRAAGHDVSGVKFQLDPGLMMRFLMPEVDLSIEPKGVVFIPHYRERTLYADGNLPRGIRMIDIDNRPESVARQILHAELVYSASLHGIIFAHALKRPCVLVAPQTQEPNFKYEDYYASVGLPLPRPLPDIESARFHAAPTSPADVRYERSDFVWPSLHDLESLGIVMP
jgi:hypothetical protein